MVGDGTEGKKENVRGVQLSEDGIARGEGESGQVKISAFTFIHNGVAGGYPFVESIKMASLFADETVVVDMQSTDETRQVLEQLDVRIIDGKWMPKTAGECLKANHALHEQCTYDVIWHFEADEVFSGKLACQVSYELQDQECVEIAVHRLQVEQNFQRCRWYPEPVHRIFKKGTAVKDGHTTVDHKNGAGFIYTIPAEKGFLWDITNCFRDDWKQRVLQQAELWDEQPQYRYVPYHFTMAPAVGEEILSQSHWTWETTPFAIPEMLKPLVGLTSYRQRLEKLGLL